MIRSPDSFLEDRKKRAFYRMVFRLLDIVW